MAEESKPEWVKDIERQQQLMAEAEGRSVAEQQRIQQLITEQGEALWERISLALGKALDACKDIRGVTLQHSRSEGNDITSKSVLINASAPGNLYGLSVFFRPGQGIECVPTVSGDSCWYPFAVSGEQVTVLGLEGQPLDRYTKKDNYERQVRADVAEELAREIVVERVLKGRYI